jgi:hypothetical protein
MYTVAYTSNATGTRSVKIHGSLSVGNKQYKAGDEIPWTSVYPFFLFHMGIFGASGFIMAYGDDRPDISFLYAHGGIAILVYTIFYLAIFGLDEVKWMFLNALFGLLGLYTQIGWILTWFGRDIGDYPLSVHVTPFLYFTLYSFLVRRAVLDLTNSTEDRTRKQKVETGYIIVTLAINLGCFLLQML